MGNNRDFISAAEDKLWQGCSETIILQVALHQYLSSAIEGFPIHKDLHIRQFAHGQSNPTYLLQVGMRIPLRIRYLEQMQSKKPKLFAYAK